MPWNEHEAEPGPRAIPTIVDELAHVTPDQWDRAAAMVPRIAAQPGPRAWCRACNGTGWSPSTLPCTECLTSPSA